MSRYVSVQVAASLDEVRAAVASLDLEVQSGPGNETLMLDGSLECAGEPVHLRFEAGTLNSVEDFGFRLDDQGVVLVCGDVDRNVLERELLAPLRAALVKARLEAEAKATGGTVQEIVEADGTRRIVLRRG